MGCRAAWADSTRGNSTGQHAQHEQHERVPNHLRPTLGVQKLKGRRSGHFIHDDLQKALDEALVHRIHGPSDVVPLNDSLCVKDRGGACSAGLVILYHTPYNTAWAHSAWADCTGAQRKG